MSQSDYKIDSHQFLLYRLKENLPSLKRVQDEMNEDGGIVESFYRFYYQSFKVQHAKNHILRMREVLRTAGLGGPDSKMTEWFEKILDDGLEYSFQDHHNSNWLLYTRDVVEAMLHAKMALDNVVHCAENIEEAPKTFIDFRWASVLCLYDLR